MTREERLIEAIVDLDEKTSLETVTALLADGIAPMRIVEASRKGLAVVGERYQRREYYLSGLVISGEIFRKIVQMVEGVLCETTIGEARGGLRVILGAPKGDVHDIGKEIVSILLRCAGFEVVDLGVNVEPQAFVDAAARSGARMVGISTLITLAYDAIRDTVRAFEEAGQREAVKIVLGGGAISKRVCDYAGADAWSKDALDAVKFARSFDK
jgi:methylmalonyl-CoA mutase cobalamin-binding domain/chain